MLPSNALQVHSILAGPLEPSFSAAPASITPAPGSNIAPVVSTPFSAAAGGCGSTCSGKAATASTPASAVDTNGASLMPQSGSNSEMLIGALILGAFLFLLYEREK